MYSNFLEATAETLRLSLGVTQFVRALEQRSGSVEF